MSSQQRKTSLIEGVVAVRSTGSQLYCDKININANSYNETRKTAAGHFYPSVKKGSRLAHGLAHGNSICYYYEVQTPVN